MTNSDKAGGNSDRIDDMREEKSNIYKILYSSTATLDQSERWKLQERYDDLNFILEQIQASRLEVEQYKKIIKEIKGLIESKYIYEKNVRVGRDFIRIGELKSILNRIPKDSGAKLEEK